LDAEGRLRIGGKGRTVDWLVMMRRLRAEDTLEHAIGARAVRKDDIDRVVRRMSAFYRERAPEPVDPEAYCDTARVQIVEDRDALLRPDYALDRERVERIAEGQRRFLDRNRDLLAQRARSQRIVEGHGDLRPEHIYLGDPPLIVDCLEFHRGFRIVDPASELAFLAMESDRLGAPAIDGWVFAVYRTETGDDTPRPLIDFYKARHALTRAVIAIRHLDDGPVADPKKWRDRTARYLALAEDYAKRFEAG
jgi:aminoglycoside phosphotransferase family enzyme